MTPETLQHALETGLFQLPPIPGQLCASPFRGISGRITPISHPLGNVVGAAAFESSAVAAKVAAVIEFFARRRTTFTWRVGPTTRPRDLGDVLERAGMRRQQSLAGMVLTSVEAPHRVESTMHVREATRQDAAVVARIIRDAYPVPSGLATILAEAFLHHAGEPLAPVRLHLAVERDSGEPVALGCSHYFASVPIMALTAAATLPAFRGRGAYRALVTHRLAEAVRRRVAAVVVQAVESTSAPALTRMGFSRACDIDTYLLAGDEPHE